MEKSTELNKSVLKILVLFPLAFVVIGLMLFLPAGSLNYWQGWLYMLTLFVPVIFTANYLIKKDPELLRRRMQFKEKEAKQKFIVKLSGILFLIGFLLPGFDYRFGWSQVPFWLVIASDLLVLLSYFFVFLVFKENSYTSRIVEVEKGQKVIATGPYSIMRHPMYFGVIVMYLFTPLALGSYFALIFFLPTIPILAYRALDEERVLLKELKGYKEYTKKVKYRLVPGIW